MENENLEVIDSTRLLGTIITNELKWEQNTAQIVKKSNARMELPRRAASFVTNTEDRKTIYYLFVRPADSQPCRSKECLGVWVLGEWSQVSFHLHTFDGRKTS